MFDSGIFIFQIYVKIYNTKVWTYKILNIRNELQKKVK